MSSMFWRLRSVLSRSHSTAPSGQNIKIYRVRFLRQPLNPSKITVIVVAHIAVGVIWASTASAFAKGEPVFIPLGMAQAVPSKPYRRDDPEIKAYHRFSNDREQVSRVRAIFREQAIEALRRAFKEKLGREVKSDASLLYFHFPPAPPPVYVQKGIEISYEADEDPNSNRRYLTFTLTTREWDHSQILMNDQIMYPSWMLSAVTNMFRNLLDLKWDDIKAILDKDSKITHSSIATQFKNDLRKNRPKPPVPRGHIVIDGMVQVISEKMVVNVDLTGSFNPHNFNDRTVQRMSVRFAGHIRRPIKPIELAPIPYPKQTPGVTASPDSPALPKPTAAEKLAPAEQPPPKSGSLKPSEKLAGALAAAMPTPPPITRTPRKPKPAEDAPAPKPENDTPAPEQANDNPAPEPANETPAPEPTEKPPSLHLPPPNSPLLLPLHASLSDTISVIHAQHEARMQQIAALEAAARDLNSAEAVAEARDIREQAILGYQEQLRRTHEKWEEMRRSLEGEMTPAEKKQGGGGRKEREARELNVLRGLGGMIGSLEEEWMRIERGKEEKEGEKGEKAWRGKGMRRVLVVRNGEVVKDEVETWGDDEEEEKKRIEEVKDDEEKKP